MTSGEGKKCPQIFLLLMLLLLQSRPQDLACKFLLLCVRLGDLEQKLNPVFFFLSENSISDRSRTSGSSVWQRANN